MAGSVEHFVDREEAIAAFDALMATSPDESVARVLLVWGMAGQGKSTLLRHLAGSNSGRTRIVDLDDVVDHGLAHSRPGAATAVLVEALNDQLSQALLAWSPAWVRPWRRWRYRRSIKRAMDQTSNMSGTVKIVADRHSAVRNTDVHIEGTRPDVLAHQIWYRQRLRDALLELARKLPRVERALMIDTSEWLGSLDLAITTQVSDDASGSLAAGHWFTSEVLARLVADAPGLRVVLAGRDRSALPSAIPHQSIELIEWLPEHTEEFMRSRGLQDPHLVAAVHEVCGGLPVWTQLLVETCLERTGDEVGDDVTWIHSQAAARPAGDWLIGQFLERLPTAMRDVVLAAAVLRTVNKQAVEQLVDAGKHLSARWFDQLTRYSFLRTTASGEMRMHNLVRVAALKYMATHEPDRREHMHRTAAAYFGKRKVFVEHAYHSFAVGDETSAAEFHQRLVAAFQAGGLDQVVALTSVLTAEEQQEAAARHLPSLSAHAFMYAAKVALAQGRTSDYERHLERARSLYERSDLVDELTATTAELADVALRRDQAKRALELYGRARSLYERVGDSSRTGWAYAGLGEASRLLGEMVSAEASFERGLAAATASGDTQARIRCLVGLGRIAVVRVDRTRATELFQAAEKLSEANDDTYHMAAVHSGMGELALIRADVAEANSCLERALALYREMGDASGTGRTLSRLARVDMLVGEYDRALQRLAAARECCAEADDQRGEAAVDRVMAGLAVLRGRPGARDLLDAARVRCERLGDRRGLGEVLRGLGRVTLAEGSATAALPHLLEARSLFEASGDRYNLAWTLALLGFQARMRYDVEASFELYGAASELFSDIGDPVGTARIDLELGRLAVWDGQPVEARRLTERAWQALTRVGDRDGLATSMLDMADREYAARNLEAARELVRQAHQIFIDLDARGGLSRSTLYCIRFLTGDEDVEHRRSLLKQACEYAEAFGDRLTMANIYAAECESLTRTGDVDAATAMLENAAAVYEELDDPAGMARVYGMRATLAMIDANPDVRTMDVTAATEHAEHAYALAVKAGSLNGILEAQLALGAIALANNESKRAEELLTSAYELSRRVGNPLKEAQAVRELGFLASERGKFGAAVDLLERSLAIVEQMEDKTGVADTHLRLASALIRHPSRRREAGKHLRLAIELLDEANSPVLAARTRELLKLLPRGLRRSG